MASATQSAAKPATSAAPAIVWLRRDLRLDDNPALIAAAQSGAPLVALFILDRDEAGDWRPGGATRWHLHGSLAALGDALQARGLPLTLRRGPTEAILGALIEGIGARSVYWNRIYEPWAMTRDAEIKTRLRARGLVAESFNGSLLFEPTKLRTQSGGAFKVFTPFWRACLAAPEPSAPLKAPAALRAAQPAPTSDALESWRLEPHRPDWANGLRANWTRGEAAALARLYAFAPQGAARYGETRDQMRDDATSRLSPYLHFGEISPRRVWRVVADALGQTSGAYLRQLIWREFAAHLLVAHPDLPTSPLDPKFSAFPWREDADGFTAWRSGRTGYPLVDAAMRELWITGHMHNRARMVAASFLVKHLLVDWRQGEAWFWDTLTDADLANNSFGWQWIAGCGADAAPFFRVFNPVLQGEKFDRKGDYVRRFVPELAKLDAKFIHRPWTAPARALRDAGVTLGETYPAPIVDHAAARARALAAFASLNAASRAVAGSPSPASAVKQRP
jgi:deoxyribodipyrimidine photo-lyase